MRKTPFLIPYTKVIGGFDEMMPVSMNFGKDFFAALWHRPPNGRLLDSANSSETIAATLP